MSVFPLAFANEEVSLLTAVVLGFLFGFTLERAGFGNARKLAAQFYLYDMTVFKVMFTAILVAMVGIYGCAALGWLDLSLLWINPTFLYAQLVGGFLLGVGFILSGLCPGTAVVSAAGGRLDAIVAFVGIFIGTLLFAVALDLFPALERLYGAGSLGTSLLHELFGMPAPLLALLVVLGAGAAFVGADKVERAFAARHPTLEHAPTGRPRLRFAVPAALALLAVGATFVPASDRQPPVPALGRIAAGDVARRVIARDPTLVVLDARTDRSATGIPGAHDVALDTSALPALARVAPGQVVVIVTDAGAFERVPAAWPRELHYARLEGGFAAWQAEVLAPATAADASLAERERVERHNQVAAFFSGARAAPTAAPPPPPAAGGGGAKKKKAGGC